MNIPDYISPIIAYRTWQWDDNGLVSLNNEPWPAGEALEANADRCAVRRQLVGFSPPAKLKRKKGTAARQNWLRRMVDEASVEMPLEHEAPADRCACGIYAAKNYKHLEKIHYIGGDNDYGVHGEVYLWGRVWDHDLGYRAQYAYPKNLTFSFKRLPWTVSGIHARLMTLAKYGVDMFLQPKQGDRLLVWSKETGFNPRAFEPVVADRAKWYAFKERERRLEAGDLLAVLGCGIGIVKAVDEQKCEVHVLLFNRQMHKIGAQFVQFDKKNYRWESSSKGSITQVGGLL